MAPDGYRNGGLSVISKEADTDHELVRHALGLVLPSRHPRYKKPETGGTFIVLTYDHPPLFRKRFGPPGSAEICYMRDRENYARRVVEGELHRAMLRDNKGIGIKLKPEEEKALAVETVLLPPTHLLQEHEVDVSYQPRERGMHHHPHVPVDQDARDELLLMLLNKIHYTAQVGEFRVYAPHNPHMFSDADRLNSRVQSQFPMGKR